MGFEKGKSGIRRRFRSNREGGRPIPSRKGSG